MQFYAVHVLIKLEV